jgi:hypothetical protein
VYTFHQKTRVKRGKKEQTSDRKNEREGEDGTEPHES